jgi:uncharacterized protein YbjT (DUF2867 family)
MHAKKHILAVGATGRAGGGAAREKKPILVIGATGRQGGATARELLRRGHDVLALTRDPDGPAARALASQGATPITGDLDDPASLVAAAAKARAVFSVQPHPLGPEGLQAEIRRGKAVADAAAGVDHLIYSSVAGAERARGVPTFDAKWEIEQHIRALGVPCTILRPATLMDNFAAHSRPEPVDGTLVVRNPLPPDMRLQMIASEDIGVFAAEAFDRPGEHIGKTLELAGDTRTGPEIAQAFENAGGAPARFERQPLDEIRAFSEDMALMWEWILANGYDSADIGALRERHPGLLTLEAWLRRAEVPA